MDTLVVTFIAAAVAVGCVKFIQHRRRLTRQRYDDRYWAIIAQLRKPR